jgi:hypothetical protein
LNNPSYKRPRGCFIEEKRVIPIVGSEHLAPEKLQCAPYMT